MVAGGGRRGTRAAKASGQSVGAPLPDSFEPLEIALDADRDQPATPARELLVQQTLLVQAQLKSERIRAASERMGLILKMLTGLAGVAAAAALGALVWDAATDHSLVIEPFSTPPDMAADGVTGQVLAVKLLDRLSAMDAASISVRRSASYASSWSSDAKVEIPTTGISVGELQRFLRAWLGRQTRISGELVRTPKGLALTVRAGSQPGEAVQSEGGDVDALLKGAAENLYRQTQPYRYAIYRNAAGDNAGAIAQLERLSQSADLTERKWAFSGLSYLYRTGRGDAAAAAAAARSALAIDPNLAPARSNLAMAADLAGDAQGSLDGMRAELRMSATAGDLDPGVARRNRADTGFYLAVFLGDGPGMKAAFNQRVALGAGPDEALDLAMYRALAALTLHDPSAAERAITPDLWTRAPTTAAPLWFSDRLERGALAEAVAIGRRLESPALAPTPWDLTYVRTNILPQVAVVMARTGALAEAQALLARLPDTSYYVQVARGQVAEIAGDRAAADRWFARTLREAPEVPLAYLEWGRILLARGTPDTAIATLAAGARKAPNYADLQLVWGEALLAKGDAAGAHKRLAAAVTLAPRWGLARLRLGDAQAALGRTPEAKAAWREALMRDLKPWERAEAEHKVRQGR